MKTSFFVLLLLMLAPIAIISFYSSSVSGQAVPTAVCSRNPHVPCSATTTATLTSGCANGQGNCAVQTVTGEVTYCGDNPQFALLACRRPGSVPPGLQHAWAVSNMSIHARQVTEAIFLNGTRPSAISGITVASSSSGQIISNVAYNSSVIQIQFDHDGVTQLTLQSTQKPTAIYADNEQLPETQGDPAQAGGSGAWHYDSPSQTLTVFADPTTVTLDYGIEGFSLGQNIILAIAAVAGLIIIIAFVFSLFFIFQKHKHKRKHHRA